MIGVHGIDMGVAWEVLGRSSFIFVIVPVEELRFLATAAPLFVGFFLELWESDYFRG